MLRVISQQLNYDDFIIRNITGDQICAYCMDTGHIEQGTDGQPEGPCHACEMGQKEYEELSREQVKIRVDGAKDGIASGYIKERRPDGLVVVQITDGLLDEHWVQRKYQVQGIKRDRTKVCRPDQLITAMVEPFKRCLPYV